MKILVTGNAGSGKSTTSKIISEKLGIERHNLDPIVWQKGWVKAPREVRYEKINELAQKDSWIIDGVSPQVLEEADVIVFLDFPKRVCYYRTAKRSARYLFTTRPEIPPYSPEILIVPRLIKIIWNFPKLVTPNILAQKKKRDEAEFIHISSVKQLNDYLDSL